MFYRTSPALVPTHDPPSEHPNILRTTRAESTADTAATGVAGVNTGGYHHGPDQAPR
jgi:hypothetical protein